MSTSNWTNEIDEITEDFNQNFGELTADQLNWKPNAETWSIAQNMDHLIVINESYFPAIKSLHKGTYKTPFTGRFSFLVNFFGRFILKSVQPDTPKKVKTFAIWEPTQSEGYSDILSRFKAHQEELKQMILNSQDLLEKETVISSPANKHIVYKLDTVFDIIVAHERRHFGQAKEVLKKLKSA
ncbi:MAG: DinB family protein [Balneolaceae bacterium]